MLKNPLFHRSKRALRLVAVAVLVVAVSACGFHLRGNIPLSDGIKNMYVIAPEGSFKDELQELLTKAGAELASSKGAADVVLNVSEAGSKRSVGTIDERGKANSYNLTFKVVYTLEGLEGELLRERTVVSEFRRYNFDPELVIESESEEEELLESMEQDAVLRILRQLSTITDYQPGQSSPSN
ncbi:LPS assembly lipoprotein LptE [Arenicella xantha]|uniref:LPS-assembly lipoprotein LptE n=1 Tax=Arenicella xantha TaxID=644221 RepID=A0A395JRP6_9GAMM|nr:LPS assembly lipoprotein LptE [Arenicella xantha]RBP53255.1 LPS-assembly lipoprotein [Arenicella xantha]